MATAVLYEFGVPYTTLTKHSPSVIAGNAPIGDDATVLVAFLDRSVVNGFNYHPGITANWQVVQSTDGGVTWVVVDEEDGIQGGIVPFGISMRNHENIKGGPAAGTGRVLALSVTVSGLEDSETVSFTGLILADPNDFTNGIPSY